MGKLIVDISSHQNSVDFEKMKKAGVHAVLIRCGYRGAKGGTLASDPRYEENVRKVEAAGLPFGLYWYTTAISTKEAEAEARYCVSLARGHKLSFPLWLDLEFYNSKREGRADHLSVAARTTYALAFIRCCEELGYKVGVYCNPDFWREALVPGKLEHYPRWIARYGKSVGMECDIWQYTSIASGKHYGAGSQYIDLNTMYTDFPSGKQSKFAQDTNVPSKTGNPYPAPTITVASNETAAYLHLQRWTDQGDMVRAVQWHLARLGYDLGATAIDGKMGKKTTAAVIAFQKGIGITPDGAVGSRTWPELDKATKKPAAPKESQGQTAPASVEKPKGAHVNYQERMAQKCQKYYPLCEGKVHSGPNVGKVVDLESLKKYKALSCNRISGICEQEAGICPKGVIVSHTPKRNGKKTIDDAVKNWRKLRHCKVVWVNKRFKDLPPEYKEAGCIYYQNSNACVSAGNGKIWSCNGAKGHKYKKGDYLKTSGYPFTSPILVVVVPEK